MNILIANDDGVFKEGLMVLCRCLASMEGVRVYVCGPDRERTCSGHGLVMRDSIKVEELPADLARKGYPQAVKVWSCSGTPADCVRMGMLKMRELGETADLVCTGINHGSNLGQDVHYSGTVASAMEAIFKGVPAIAFSLCSSSAVHFENFENLVPQIVNKTFGRFGTDVFLNVNVPDIPKKEIKGIKLSSLGPRDYDDRYNLVSGDRKSGSYLIDSDEVFPEIMDPDWDVTANREGWVTLSPVQRMSHSEEAMEKLAGLNLEFC